MRSGDLRELARLYGVQLSYEDASGKRREASREALTAVLRRRLPDGLSFEEALRERRERPHEPVTVRWGRARLELPRGSEVILEDGSRWSAGAPMPYGYHTVRSGGGESLLIAAPRRAHPLRGRQWGVFVPLYAAHTREKAEGDLGVLQQVLDWMRELGGSIVATLPMLAAFDDEPSPYSPLSRLFWNERYLDRGRLPERGETLEECVRSFQPDEEFERFARDAWEFAWFRSRVDEQRDPRSEARPRSYEEVRSVPGVRRHLYLQFRMAQQLRELAGTARATGTGLYLDFPLGVNAGGYDVWRYPGCFAKGVSTGAPPDAFFTKGQNWGFPPFDPDGLRRDRYGYFRAAIRNHMAHAGVLRLDHVMGLHRLFWIPEGAEPKDGVYVRYPDEELYAIVVLESFRAGCAVVGEDLGTVPEYVPRAMKRRGLRRMYVVQYEAKPESPPLHPPPRASVASLNTHDMPTFAGYWTGRDIDDRFEQELLSPGEAEAERDARRRIRERIGSLLQFDPADPGSAAARLLQDLAASEAEVVLVNLEDLWGELVPQNVPGVPERSWRNRFRLSLEEARSDARVTAVLRTVQGARLA
jgi:4-alpha-glucanotransferase